MAIVVVGGHSRNVGKTSVVAGLVAALPEYAWTAVKITQYGHGVCSRNGEPCDCAPNDESSPDSQEHPFAITEETDRAGGSDTSRFLAAGAKRAVWVRTRQGFLGEAMPRLQIELARARNAIIESNSVLGFIAPDLYLSVLNPSNPDFKDSAREYLGRADAILLHEPHAGPLHIQAWEGIRLAANQRARQFKICPPNYLTDEVLEFVRARLK